MAEYEFLDELGIAPALRAWIRGTDTMCGAHADE